MTTNIQLLRSSIAHKRPDPTMLLEGQAAVNISPNGGSAGLYFALTDDTLVKVGPVAFSPISPPNTTPAGHPGHSIGEEWIDTSPNYFQPVQKVYNGSRWVSSSGFLTDDNTGDFTLSKTMHLRTMEAHGKAQYSYIRVPQDNYDARRIITGAAGMFRFNNDEQTLKFEGHDGSQWVQFATSSGSTTLEDLELTGDLQSSGNVDLCSNCNNDFRVRGEGLFDCSVSIEAGINVKGNGVIQGEQITLNTNLSDKTYINGGLTTSGDSEFHRSLVVGRLGNSSVFTVNCPSYLLEDTRIGVDATHKLLVSGVAEFREYTDLRNDVKIGDTISNDLLVNSTARFRGHVELGDPTGSTNLDVHSTTTFLKNVSFQENVVVGTDSTDVLTVKSYANFQNNVTIGQQGTDTLQVLANLVQVNDADFKENVIIGTDPFDELTVNATSVFNASVQLGSEAAQVVHVKATPKFHTNLVPSTNLGSSLGEADTRFGDMHIHNGSATGKLTVHELEVQHKTSFATDFSIGFDDLHDFEVKATTLFSAPVGFERDVFIGDSFTDILTVESTAEFKAPVSLRDTLFVDGTLTINDNILPNIDDTYSLGSTDDRWDTVYAVNGEFTEALSTKTLDAESLRVSHNTHLGTDNYDDLIVDATLRQNAVAFFGDDVTIGDDAFDELFIKSSANLYANTTIGLIGNIGTTNLDVYSTSYFYSAIYPDADGSVDVGSSVQRWRNIHGVNAYLTHDLTVGSNCDDNFLCEATATFTCDLTVQENVDISGDVDNSGNVNLNGSCADLTTINGRLKSLCDVELNTHCGDLTHVKGQLKTDCEVVLNETQGNTTIHGSLGVKQTATIDSTLTVKGNTLLEENLFVRQNSTIDLTLLVKGSTTIKGSLTSEENVTLNTNIGDLTRVRGEFVANCNVDLNTDQGKTNIFGKTFIHNDTTIHGELYSKKNVTVTEHVLPEFNNTSDLGAPSTRWRNVYTNDLHLSNRGSEGNSVDGTWGDWTIQEGEENLYLINNRSGVVFKMNLTPVNL